MAKITVLVGIPCSGKSTFCKKFPNSDIISRDAIRLVFWGKDYEYTDENEKRVTDIFMELFATSVKEGRNIISDNTHCKEKYIDVYLKNIPKGYELEIIFFDVPLWKAFVRNIWRYIWTKKWVPFGIIAQMKTNFDRINKKKYGKIGKTTLLNYI